MHAWWIRVLSSAYGSLVCSLSSGTAPSATCAEGTSLLSRSWRPMSGPREARQEVARALLLLALLHDPLRHGVERLGEVRPGFGEHGRLAAVDRERHRPVGRDLVAHLLLERRLHLPLLHPDLRMRQVEDDPDAAGREREQIECPERQAHVLQGRHVEAAPE